MEQFLKEKQWGNLVPLVKNATWRTVCRSVCPIVRSEVCLHRNDSGKLRAFQLSLMWNDSHGVGKLAFLGEIFSHLLLCCRGKQIIE
jgi:hypothetical protein